MLRSLQVQLILKRNRNLIQQSGERFCFANLSLRSIEKYNLSRTCPASTELTPRAIPDLA